MMKPTPLTELLRQLDPYLHEGTYAFCACPRNAAPAQFEPLAMFLEDEGCSLIVTESTAQRAQLPVMFRAAWITLRVNSELHALGLTAAVATALADAGIPCNMLAALRHDHVFVPVEMAGRAMLALCELQESAAHEPA